MNTLFKYTFACALTLGAAALTSCDDYLDVMPDNRAEVNSVEKVTAILVTAYPDNTEIVMTEMASDNAMDNGSTFTVEDKVQEEAYLWMDITRESNDSPKSFWNSCYTAIASANLALEAIEEMGGGPEFNAQKGEALMCRAYGHFILANFFCLAYNPATAEKDLGIPYSDHSETTPTAKHERGNMKDLYEKINKDIEEGLPLINDEIYSVPKYHFNRKAAYAFAARFNLYYWNLDKTIEYANVVLGAAPEKVLRDWSAMIATASNWTLRTDMYIDASNPANLLMTTSGSSWGYWGGPYNLGRRYGHAQAICNYETVRACDNNNSPWVRVAPGASVRNYYPGTNLWGYDEKLCVTKIGGYFEYTDKVAGIGYRRNVNVKFSTDETLLCRAEAYALKNELDKAIDDLNIYNKTHTQKGDVFTKESFCSFYANMATRPLSITNDKQRTPKNDLHPLGVTLAEGDQTSMVQGILHIRRCETIHEGLRWQDIKRYGIEIAHNRDGLADDVLTLDDPRRAFQLPSDVLEAGLEPNPRNK